MQERLIQLLEAIAGAAKPVSVTNLVDATGFPKATVYRNIASLSECGFVEETEAGNRYVLGMRFVRIALTGKSDTHVINAVSSVMQKAVKDLGEATFLARFRGGRVDLIHIEVPTDPLVSYIYPGMGERPAHACSSAKVIAAFIHPDMRKELLSKTPIQFTPRTLIDPEMIEREITQVQQDMYAVCDGEIDEGVTSVAVPVIIDRLGSIFSIGIVGPSHRINGIIQDQILPVLSKEAVRAAAAIQHCSVIDTEIAKAEAFSMTQERAPQTH